MKAKHDKSTKRNRADGKRAVLRRSITLSERRMQKLYNDVHEAAMKIRIDVRRSGVWEKGTDDLLFRVQKACCDAALASVRKRI